MPALSYWAILGEQQFPLLSKIALRLFTIPTSSAASERVWSVYSFIHSKRRNRLKTQSVEKLAYIYINANLLDSIDAIDYFNENNNIDSDWTDIDD